MAQSRQAGDATGGVDLRDAWQTMWEALGAAPEMREAAYDAIALDYGGVHRHYFRLSYVRQSLRLFHVFRKYSADPDALEAAIWFSRSVHYTFGDAVNHGFFESADRAYRVLLDAGVPAGRVLRICTLVRALDRPLTAEDAEELLLIDVERMVFGLGSEAYGRAERRIRREYKSAIDDVSWRHIRVALLEEILRQGVYRTPAVASMFRDRAQRNISGEIARLRRGVVRT